jgi:hypothetical protein
MSPLEISSDLPRLAAPARRALAAAGIERLEQLIHFSEAEVSQWHGIGPSALKQLRQALSAAGLAFASPASVAESYHHLTSGWFS